MYWLIPCRNKTYTTKCCQTVDMYTTMETLYTQKQPVNNVQ